MVDTMPSYYDDNISAYNYILMLMFQSIDNCSHHMLSIYYFDYHPNKFHKYNDITHKYLNHYDSNLVDKDKNYFHHRTENLMFNRLSTMSFLHLNKFYMMHDIKDIYHLLKNHSNHLYINISYYLNICYVN